MNTYCIHCVYMLYIKCNIRYICLKTYYKNFLNHIVLFNIIWSIFSIYVPSSFRSSPTILKYDCNFISQSFFSLSCKYLLNSDPLLLTTNCPLYTKFQSQQFLLTLTMLHIQLYLKHAAWLYCLLTCPLF